jgi:hypothetical protein
MKRNRLLLLLALLMTAATGAWAQEQWDVVWDFTAWSTETVTALKADAAASKLEGWSDVEKKADAEAGADPTAATKDNCFWSCSGTVNADGNLSANGVVIKEFQGLKFNSDYAAQRELAIAVNYPSTSLGTYHGSAYLYLGGKNQTCFTIPGVKAGSKITIEVESHKTSSARGIGLYKNSYAEENLIGEQFTPKTLEAKTWEIAEDCNVVVYNTNNCHIYTIKVKAPAAAASAGYSVTMKDGVKDADKWTVKVGEGQAQALPIGGLKGDGTETVTLQYNGRLKVKGVKATSVPDGAINGKFSVSDTKQVYFSKGNLQATYDGSTWSWDFAKNQWDYIGADNNKVNGNGSVSSNCTIDVFGWSTSSNNFGIHNSKTDGDYSGDFVDWGTAIGSGWRTLTHDEWNFLLQSRTTTSGLLFAKANLFGTVHGLILFPDNYTHPDGLAAITAPNDATGNAGWNGNQYTAEEWAKMEAAGAVFLPAAGCREGTTNHNFNVIGYYHTATPADANNSYDVAFHASVLEFDWNQPNHWAFSVRLVCAAE